MNNKQKNSSGGLLLDPYDFSQSTYTEWLWQMEWNRDYWEFQELDEDTSEYPLE